MLLLFLLLLLFYCFTCCCVHSQTDEVQQRLKSLQDDYSALQSSHERLELDTAARESELHAQIVRLREMEQEGMVERREKERAATELQMRVAELERERPTRVQDRRCEVRYTV